MHVGTYGVFGKFESAVIELSGPLGADTSPGARAELRVVSLKGFVATTSAERVAWVRRAAEAVADYYHGFPTERLVVAIAPVPKSPGVSFGRVLPESRPGIAMALGADATPATLDADWILVHELFHVGVPSFFGEGTWLDEGLATYAELIIRARAGLLTEKAVWTEFANGMPRGLWAMRNVGLAKTEDSRAIYWGGALTCLMADVAARRRSHGKVGLEDGLRAVLRAGGRVSDVWPLDKVLATVDEALGAPIVEDLAATYSFKGSPVDFDGLLDQLGVERVGNEVVLRDDAPLAALRKQIVFGPYGAADGQ
jgi:hypothetical protein